MNAMCDVTQCVCSVAISHVNGAELSHAFMEGAILKLGFCMVVLVDDKSKFVALFESMASALNIRLHHVDKRRHNDIGVEYYNKFINYNATISSAARQTHK